MISVVVPTFNEGERVGFLVEHLAEIKGIREIVIVDASNEPVSKDYLRALEALPRVLVVRADHRGRAVQMNQGAKACQGDTLLFLHCDSILPVSAAAEISSALQQKRWGRFDVRLDADGIRFRVIEAMIQLRSRVTNIATGDQSIFMGRQFFEQIGGYAEIPLMEDIELSKRIGKSYPPALITEAVTTSSRRWVKDGTVKTILLMWKLRMLYWLGVDPNKLANMYRNAR